MPSPLQWWESLSPLWRQAFSLSGLQGIDQPSAEEINGLANMVVLRLAGPSAPHPNCNFEIQDLSGIAGLQKLEILIVTHHAIKSLKEVAQLPNLKSLMVFNNKIESLEGVENLEQLEMLYVQCNQLTSISEVQRLTNLKELYVSDNLLTSLDGLTEDHAENLKRFVCMPNEHLKQKAIINAERELGIICR